MSLTFADVYSAVHLRVAAADPLLIREWVQEVYREACDKKLWSHQRVETAIVIKTQRTLTCTATLGSATVIASLDPFAATDVGRQIRISSIPIYTIIAVADDLTSATLDRVYSETSGAASFTILDAYWTAPADFWRFLVVADPTNKWKLKWWVTEDQLATRDPGRMSTGSPWCLVNQKYSPVPGQTGRARFEVYPYATSARSFIVTYYTKPVELADDTELIGPFAQAKGTLVEGALAKCALWPGTSTVRNPYFNLPLADQLERRFQEKLDQLIVKDEDLYLTSMPMSSYGWAPGPFDSNWLQNHVPETIESSW